MKQGNRIAHVQAKLLDCAPRRDRPSEPLEAHYTAHRSHWKEKVHMFCSSPLFFSFALLSSFRFTSGLSFALPSSFRFTSGLPFALTSSFRFTSGLSLR